ncbi:MAG TPA: ABC transporter substrate-binding protein [Acidimicrobiales bacterium]|nr:ABC transporter substrate-binding protein [Acidimicrobiales bacterium]
MPDRIDRRGFLARGAVTVAGVAAAGTGMGTLLSACSSSSAGSTSSGTRNGVSTGTPKQGGTLVFGIEAEDQGFDPASARFDEVGVLYARTVFDPLTIVAADGSIQPYLAQAVTPNADYSVWTITARPDVTFHDGTPCDAAAIAGSMEHFLSGIYSFTVAPITKVSVSSPTTVTVTMNQPWVPFPAYLAGGIGGQIGYIVAPSMIANPNSATHPVGTGPFKFGEWVPNDHFTANRNASYWRTGMPYLDSITYRPIIDNSQRGNSLTSGQIGIMHTDDPTVILQFRDNPSYDYVDDSGQIVGEPDMNFVMLNLQAAPMTDSRVRQAMAMAVSSQQFSQIIDKGVNAPCDQPFVQGTPYYTSSPGYPAYNPSQARSLVQQVQSSTGKPVSFTLTSTNSAYAVKIAQYLQVQFQNVGMQVQLAQIQQADEINDALAGKFQALVWRQFAAADPDINYLWWSPTEVQPGFAVNFARNTDPQVEAALQTGRRSTNPQARAQAYQQVAQLLNKDLPYIWNDRTTWAVASGPKVQNWNNPTTPSGAKAQGMVVGTIWPTQIWLET